MTQSDTYQLDRCHTNWFTASITGRSRAIIARLVRITVIHRYLQEMLDIRRHPLKKCTTVSCGYNASS